MQSEILKLNKTDWKSIGRGALIAIAGVLLTYGSEVIAQIDFGNYTPIVVAFWSVVANVGKKFLSGE